MKKPNTRVIHFLEHNMEEYAYYGRVQFICTALNLLEQEVTDTIRILETNGEVRVFWFADGWLILKFLPFTEEI